MKVVTLHYPVDKITEKAISIVGDFGKVWIPRSQLVDAKKRKSGDVYEYKVTIPYWLASEKGLTARDYNGNYVYISEADVDFVNVRKGIV